jgi:sensor c-di-GMP phosphodiesterase-like protein
VGVRSSTRKKVFAALAGIVLAGAPMLGFYYWLQGAIERRGLEEVEFSVRRSIALAENRLDLALAGLDDLSRREIVSCRGTHIDSLRQVTFAVLPIKELSIVAADGKTLCSDGGLSLNDRTVLTAQRATPAGVVLIELLRIEGQLAHVLRLRRPSSGTTLAALVPTDALLLQVSTRGEPFRAFLNLSLRDGTPIKTFGSEPKPGQDLLSATHYSDRYGLVATVAMAGGGSENAAELRVMAIVLPAVIAALMFGFAVLVPWRAKGDPADAIRRALEAGEFVPYYQPLIDIRTGQLRGAEVLIRWRRSDGSIVPPGAFIHIAESSGLVVDMTRDLMRKACEEVGPAFARRPHLEIAFNVAAQHFADEGIVAEVRDIVGRTKVQLSQVVLEVTERQPLDDLTATRRVIASLQGIGVRVAIDDVGTGHSGLSYMLKLGVDIIKIDKMFVDAIGREHGTGTIIETLVGLAHNLRMEIIAEGVEHFEQVVYLRDLGIPLAQGYVFSPPLPGPSFLQLIEAADPAGAASGQAEAAEDAAEDAAMEHATAA